MPKINRGKVINNEYVKNVSWNSAVLWMTKEISLPSEEMDKIVKGNVHTITFVDKNKGFKMVFPSHQVLREMQFKQVGQEPQFYWSIYLGNKYPIKNEKNN